MEGNRTLGESLSRRDISRTLLVGLAATITRPLHASHPVWAHLANEDLLSRADVELANPSWKPLFLNSEQYEMVQTLSEAVIPGSTKAFVSRFIDFLLSVDTSDHQSKFLASLGVLQAEGSKRFSKAFPALSPTQQSSLLDAVSTAPEISAIREAFENLKSWISGSYYSSEMGMRELGWTPDRAFASFPGCTGSTRLT